MRFFVEMTPKANGSYQNLFFFPSRIFFTLKIFIDHDLLLTFEQRA